jgi:hypothetical protein
MAFGTPPTSKDTREQMTASSLRSAIEGQADGSPTPLVRSRGGQIRSQKREKAD